jgi:hypothetical protein
MIKSFDELATAEVSFAVIMTERQEFELRVHVQEKGLMTTIEIDFDSGLRWSGECQVDVGGDVHKVFIEVDWWLKRIPAKVTFSSDSAAPLARLYTDLFLGDTPGSSAITS